VGTGRGGTKLHASVAGSRVTAFLATAAPWEPYFTDNPRIFLVKCASNTIFVSLVKYRFNVNQPVELLKINVH
jgi:hypothetical protein